MAYSASPFVTAIHLHLPPFARTSAEMLRRFVSNMPPATRLDVVTMSAIGKPRVSSMRVAELRPARERFGMVNYVRDGVAVPAAAVETKKVAGVGAGAGVKANAELEKRKWWHFPPVKKFNIQEGNEGRTKNGWVWVEVAKTVGRKRGDGKA